MKLLKFILIISFGISASLLAQEKRRKITAKIYDGKFSHYEIQDSSNENTSLMSFSAMLTQPPRTPLPGRILSLFRSVENLDFMFGVSPSTYKPLDPDKCKGIPNDIIESDTIEYACEAFNSEGVIIETSCTWQVISLGTPFGGDGGHNEYGHTGERPGGNFTKSGSTSKGQNFILKYEAPEIAGLEILELSGIANVEGTAHELTPFYIGVYTSTMGPFAVFWDNKGMPDQALVQEGYEGYELVPVTRPSVNGDYFFDIGSHQGDGHYVNNIITAFYLENLKSDFDKAIPANWPAPLPLKYTSMSLRDGGLFDINKDWKPSHCGHRRGDQIDIGMSTLRNLNEKTYLQRVILKYGVFEFPYATERLSNPSASHWHMQVKE